MLPHIILHLDMNSYFASVEQQANPHLRGRSVGVVATMSPNGCVIASSVEAKARGIKTGVRVKEVLALDPKTIFIPNDPNKYRSVTEGFLKICRTYTEDIEVYSIDEVFLNLTGFVHGYSEAQAIAEKIQIRIKDEVGEWLRCSIGISPTRWLAKFAGDTADKGKINIVHRGNLQEKVDPRPLTDAWGIAHRMERRLNLLNMYSLGHLRHYPVTNLMQVFGIWGYEFWANLNGIEIPGLRTPNIPKSIGHEHVFAKKATSLDYPKAVLAKLCDKAGRRLRKYDFEAQGIWMRYGLPQSFDYPASQLAWSGRGAMRGGGGKLPFPLYDTGEIFKHCWDIFIKDLPRGALPNFMAMGLFWLKPRVNQLELWPRPKQQDSPALAHAIDDLNDRYGDFTVTRGSFWGLTERDAPDRVGFRKSVGYNAATDRYTW